MATALVALAVLVLAFAVLFYLKRKRAAEETARFSISPAQLRSLIEAPNPVFLLDVRHPLDLLADPHIIPGSVRIPPKEVIANPALVPYDRDVVFYCTCPSDETSRLTVRKAIKANHTRVKFLRGGLAAWKAQGSPVETYDTAFHLDTFRPPGCPELLFSAMKLDSSTLPLFRQFGSRLARRSRTIKVWETVFPGNLKKVSCNVP
jgi:rhodanese-related sulfurtransferase